MKGSEARTSRLPPVLALRGVRVHLAACAAGLAVAAALAFASYRHADAASERLVQARAAVEAARAQLAEHGGVEAMTRLARYRDVAAGGVFGDTDAVAWAEALLAAAAARRLPAPSFDIGPREPLAADAVAGEREPQVQVQTMRFSVRGLHEEDLLGLLQSLRGAGAFRVEQCRLQRGADDAGLTAECTLHWLVWPRKNAPGTEGAT